MNTILEAGLELVELAFFLIEVLDEAATALLHFIKTALQTNPVWSLVALTVLDLVICHRVLRVPYVMRDKFLDLVLPSTFQIIVVHVFNLVHQALDILNEDVVTGDQNSFLCATTTASSDNTWCAVGR